MRDGSMKSKIKAVLILAALLLLTSYSGKASATLYCSRPYSELTVNPGRPYNAVGFLNNGCTAFLIDANHIVAAAHCFERTDTGAWQTGLRFYPNFHPDRVTADEKHVPRGDVTRVVVGSRAGENLLGAGMDWGVARVDNWKDTAGLDLTPLNLALSVPGAGTALVNPAYTRSHFPYSDTNFTAWDHMVFDTQYCSWVRESAPGKNDGGVWAILMRTAPIYDGVNRDIVGCNSRWGAGYIHADCSLTRIDNNVVVHNCDTVGGSSGSPVMYQDSLGNWSAIGVGHGGGPTDFDSIDKNARLAPVCTADTPARRDNVGASVERFRYALRFASNVAVHRRPDNTSATAIFAVDNDLNQVVYRARNGNYPTYTSDFDFWKSLGIPYPGAKLTRIAACSADASGKPQVFVVADNARIYTRSVLPNGNWGPWSNFGIAGSVNSVADIDAASDASGRCLLFMIANGGGAFTRAKITDTQWGDWFTVAGGSFKSISALNYAGVVWAAMIDTSGEIWQTSLGQAGWTAPIKLSRPAGITAWRDIDMTWDEAARGFMLAIPTNAGNNLWFVPLYGSQPWSDWRRFETHLWAPGAAPQNAPSMQSITASRWMEDPAGTTSPVVFATDDSGNIYFIEYARAGTSTPGWILDWKSFYHERILYSPPTTLRVNKVVIPANDTGRFNLQIDGLTRATDVPNGGSTGPLVVSPGVHTVGEIAGTNTGLTNYSTVIGGDCAPNGTVTLADGDNKTCRITNTSVSTTAICLSACMADRDFCMSEVGKPGGPLARECAQKYNSCRRRCSP